MSGLRWWQTGIVYQVYPRSYCDSNGDGIGDLAGIMQRLPYLRDLGVDAVWISPIYPSPMADFGYDVSDYCGIDPIFGTLEDFDRLVAAAHASGLRLILDFVPNHTSDRHPWFQASRSSRTDPQRDWYLWRDPAPDGGPPNNWLSAFGGSAWEFDEATGQYYLHSFLRQQPDLNWRNPAVRAAMHAVLRFWLRRGVDGFRVDVIYRLIKDDQYRDDPINPDYGEHMESSNRLLGVYSVDRPEVQEIIAEMRGVVAEFSDRVLIGEIYLPFQRLMAYYGRSADGVHLPFNFSLIAADWRAQSIARLVDEYEAALPPGGWPNWVLGNHDKPRIASRVGEAQARVAAMLLLTLRGTPTIYYGDEIGMHDVPIPKDEVQDPFEKNEPGKGLGRDPQRTPMCWDASAGAGFSTATPWLRLGADHAVRNVETQRAEPRSMLRLYQRLIALRRRSAALHVGAYAPVMVDGDVFVFRRRNDDEQVFVALNFGPHPAQLPREVCTGARRVALSTALDRDEPLPESIPLRPDEGLILL